jgi:hypothetical protein
MFFKTILIQLPCNPFKYIFVHMRQKKTFKVLSFEWCKNIVCYDLALQGNDEKNISMIFSLILNLPIKRPSVQKTLHFFAKRLVCSYIGLQIDNIWPFMEYYKRFKLCFIGSKRVEHGQKL